MAGTPGKRRVLLLFSVLAGLFLMHGLTGGGAGVEGCHGMAPSAMVMTPDMTPTAMTPTAMTPTRALAGFAMALSTDPASLSGHQVSAPTMAGAPDPASVRSHIGETCTPLRPETGFGLFAALLLAVVVLWQPRLPHGARLIRPHWPNGPPRTGVQVLTTLSISRT